MRRIELSAVTDAVKELFTDACVNIPDDILGALRRASEREESELGREVLEKIIENDMVGREKNLPICQDTGVAVVYLTIGSGVYFEGDIYAAVNDGVREAYTEAYFRKSMVRHPLDRVNTKDNTPAVVHIKMISGDGFRIDVAPKGGGSENMSRINMMIPADGEEGIKNFVLDTVISAGGKPCPPIIVGVGIGGNFEKCALMAKEALLRDIDDSSEDPIANRLEKELYELINKTGIGPMGFGGSETCLAVKVNVFPCHIASMPVAVNIQCHSARHRSREL